MPLLKITSRVFMPVAVAMGLAVSAAPAQAATPNDVVASMTANTRAFTDQVLKSVQMFTQPVAPVPVSPPVTMTVAPTPTPVAPLTPVKGIPKTTVVKGIPKTTVVKGIPKTTAVITTSPTTAITTTPAGVSTTPSEPTATPHEVTLDPTIPIAIRPRIDTPNHHWATDPLSMFMAATLGPVLHRVNGSWFNAPDVPREAYAAEVKGHALMGPGTPIYVGDDSVCTLTAAGYDKEGNKVGITAGHCGHPGDEVMSADSWPIGVVGYLVGKDTIDDWSVIRFTEKADVSRTYNGVTLNSVGDRAADGEIVCKTGVSTGTTCGPQFLSDQRVALAQYCAGHGDSGAPVYRNGQLVGLVGSGVFAGSSLPCTTPLQGPFFAPAATHNMGVILAQITKRDGYGAGFVLPSPDGSDPRDVAVK